LEDFVGGIKDRATGMSYSGSSKEDLPRSPHHALGAGRGSGFKARRVLVVPEKMV
jgi:hypothetical protein